MGISWLDEDSDRIHMQLALEQAMAAEQDGEVPVGAVIVHPEKGVIGQARNAKETLRDPTAHAEILAIGQAAEASNGIAMDISAVNADSQDVAVVVEHLHFGSTVVHLLLALRHSVQDPAVPARHDPPIDRQLEEAGWLIQDMAEG
jgi:hypothetical protein